MTSFNCVLHGRKHTNPFGWKLREWNTEKGVVRGWGCLESGEATPYEFTPQRIKDERKEYAADQLQSHRGGNLSREWVETYPVKARELVKAGIITKQEVKKSKYVWKERELKNWESKKKIDAGML